MDDAVRVRDAAREAVMDIEPGPLRTALHTRLTDTAMTPAVLTLASARALSSSDESGDTDDMQDKGEDQDRDGPPISDGAGNASGGTHGHIPESGVNDSEVHSHDPNAESSGDLNKESADESSGHRRLTQQTDAAENVHRLSLVDRAAGVQLIYEGLRLTRTLADTEPWVGSTTAKTGIKKDIDADLEVLAADVFVSRGFALLARTDAAGRAVDVVRAFGQDQTLQRIKDDENTTYDGNLEADIFALAVAVGASAVGKTATQAVLEYASELSHSYTGTRTGTGTIDQGLPPEEIISETVKERIHMLNTTNQEKDNPMPSSTTDQY